MLLRFLEELELWNRRVNLTSVPASQYWERHVLESLELIRRASPEPAARVLDLGSGGGIPGVIAAVARPDLEMVLMEADARKAAFLVHVAGTLRLRSVTVATRRAEAAASDPALREGFQVVLSRAAAAPARLLELAMPLTRAGGRLCALVAGAEVAAQSCRSVAASLGAEEPVALGPGVLCVRKPLSWASNRIP